MSIEGNKKWFEKIFKIVLEKRKPKGRAKSLKVLDFGCGDGASTVQGKEMGLTVIGLELDPKYHHKLAEAEKYDPTDIIAEDSNIKYYDGKKFPFKDRQFDVLTAKTSIIKDFTIKGGNCVSGNGSLLNKSAAMVRIKEIYRVMKKNGLVIITHHPDKCFRTMENLLNEDIIKEKNLELIHMS